MTIEFDATEIRAISCKESAQTVGPWVKTSDRLPTEADGKVVLAASWDAGGWCRWTAAACDVEADADYWMPIPPLPGEENK